VNFDSFVLAASLSDLGAEPRARERADAVEFRMDLADGDPIAALDAYDGELPVIGTNRAASEGGESPAGPERLAALEDAARLPAVAAVDLELSVAETERGESVLSTAAEAGVETVVSAHDFRGTPSRERLRSRLERASDVGTVGKLAVTAEDRGEVLALLSVTHDLSRAGRRVATIAMGHAGRHSRAVAPLYGSRIGYAPVDPEDATAPGQYDLAELAELIATLQ
jgi:3-dehydroquinate dehydratase-1